MTFNDATNLAEDGKKISRLGWNGGGMFVFYIPKQFIPVTTSSIYLRKPLYGEELVECDEIITINPYFLIKNVDGTLSTWVPSINDVLAIDWEVVI